MKTSSVVKPHRSSSCHSYRHFTRHSAACWLAVIWLYFILLLGYFTLQQHLLNVFNRKKFRRAGTLKTKQYARLYYVVPLLPTKQIKRANSPCLYIFFSSDNQYPKRKAFYARKSHEHLIGSLFIAAIKILKPKK